jgi:hypothetical protein
MFDSEDELPLSKLVPQVKAERAAAAAAVETEDRGKQDKDEQEEEVESKVDDDETKDANADDTNADDTNGDETPGHDNNDDDDGDDDDSVMEVECKGTPIKSKQQQQQEGPVETAVVAEDEDKKGEPIVGVDELTNEDGDSVVAVLDRPIAESPPSSPRKVKDKTEEDQEREANLNDSKGDDDDDDDDSIMIVDSDGPPLKTKPPTKDADKSSNADEKGESEKAAADDGDDAKKGEQAQAIEPRSESESNDNDDDGEAEKTHVEEKAPSKETVVVAVDAPDDDSSTIKPTLDEVMLDPPDSDKDENLTQHDATERQEASSTDSTSPLTDGTPTDGQSKNVDAMDVDGCIEDGNETNRIGDETGVKEDRDALIIIEEIIIQASDKMEGDNEDTENEERQQPQKEEALESSAADSGTPSSFKLFSSDGDDNELKSEKVENPNFDERTPPQTTESTSSRNNKEDDSVEDEQVKVQLEDAELKESGEMTDGDQQSDIPAISEESLTTSGKSDEIPAPPMIPARVDKNEPDAQPETATGALEKGEGDLPLDNKDDGPQAQPLRIATNDEADAKMETEGDNDVAKQNNAESDAPMISKENITKREQKDASMEGEASFEMKDYDQIQPPAADDATTKEAVVRKIRPDGFNDGAEGDGNDEKVEIDTNPKSPRGEEHEDVMPVDVAAKSSKMQAATQTIETPLVDMAIVSPTKEDPVEEAEIVEVKEETKKRPPLYEWPIEEESDVEDESVDVFAVFQGGATKKRRKKKAKFGSKAGSIQVVLSFGKGHEKRKTIGSARQHEPNHDAADAPFVLWDDKDTDGGLEDSLKFFQEPHEDQDPAFITWQREKAEKNYAEKLKRLEEGDKSGRKQIEDLITTQLQEKQASTDRSVEKYRIRTTAERDKDIQRLLQMYKDKMQSNEEKINQGIQVLGKRHQQEQEKLRQQHRLQIQQRRLPEHMANQEWAAMSLRLRSKQERQLQDFKGKGEEVKKRCDTDHNREREKLRGQFEKRMRDIEANRQSIYARMYSGFQQLRQRYIKRHIQKVALKKESLTAERSSTGRSEFKTDKKGIKDEKMLSPRDTVKGTMEDKIELRPPSPIKTLGERMEESPQGKSGAATRHKHRKGVLSQINKQLAVEIHNEGIWIYALVDKKADAPDGEANTPGTTGNDGNSHANKQADTTSVEEKEFIPWGVAARDVLESIICGEIPRGYGRDRFDFGETTAPYGGHVRCVMTDLRTSDETASMQRAEAAHEQEEAGLQDLETKTAEVATQITASENALAQAEKEEKDCSVKVDEAVKDSEKSKRNMANFRTKFSRYLGPGKCSHFLPACLSPASVKFTLFH